MQDLQNPPKDQMNPPERLFYLDNIKWLVIVLVVIMHLKVTYGDMGLWYYNESEAPDTFSFYAFGAYGSFCQAFIMGVMFFIAGYFTPKSLDKKGLKKFIGDRFARLGVPTLIYMLLINPLIILILSYFKNTRPNLIAGYLHYLFSLEFLRGSGPLWFCVALLIFSIIYALIKACTGKRTEDDSQFTWTTRLVLTMMIVLSVSTFIFRIIWPSGSRTHLFCNMQLGNFAQYIMMFALGILAYRKNALQTIEYRFGAAWFALAFVMGIPFWIIIFLAGNGAADVDLYLSGVHWQSFAYAAWESFFCIAISMGLVAVFKKKYNVRGKIESFLSSNAFAVYIFHPLIVVCITLLASNLAIYPLLKWAMMSVMIVPTCFIFSHFIRKIPTMKTLFS